MTPQDEKIIEEIRARLEPISNNDIGLANMTGWYAYDVAFLLSRFDSTTEVIKFYERDKIPTLESKLASSEEELGKFQRMLGRCEDEKEELEITLNETREKIEESTFPRNLTELEGRLIQKQKELLASEALVKELGEALENLMLGPESFYEEIVNNHSCIKALAKFKKNK